MFDRKNRLVESCEEVPFAQVCDLRLHPVQRQREPLCTGQDRLRVAGHRQVPLKGLTCEFEGG